MTEKNNIIYKLKKMDNEQKKYSQNLQEKNINPIMADLYALRNIKDFEDINLIQKLEPFSNMKGIKEAAKMLAQAIFRKEKICIVADYDVDGATACAIAVRGLKMFGANVDYVVPNRFVHGYGLTPSVVDEAIQRKNPDIIVTVDNGISSFAGVDHAHKKGLKVLVTDHHLAGDSLPQADCIVNPNQPGCNFANKSIAGCGVMFYVLSALRQHMIDLEVYTSKTVPNVFSLLDLVAIGTVADVVKLEKNNRILVKLGLDLIHKKQTRHGVLALIEEAKRKYDQLTTIDIGFALGPRLNAAGRLEDMTVGINCLLTDNPETAQKLAKELNEKNQSRKKIETEMKEQALELSSLKDGNYGKIAYDPSFHEGVIGIVASRVKELFYRPTIVFADAQEEGYLKGSGRSIPEIHLRDVLDYVYKKRPDVIEKFGGHSMAAGLTIRKEHLDDFSNLFEKAIEYFSQGKEFINMKEIDLDLDTSYITFETAEAIRKEIWGQGFPQPLFVGKFNILNQKILKDAHLKLWLEKDGQDFEGIWFFNDKLIECEEINVIYSIGINEFLNKKTLQILIENEWKEI